MEILLWHLIKITYLYFIHTVIHFSYVILTGRIWINKCAFVQHIACSFVGKSRWFFLSVWRVVTVWCFAVTCADIKMLPALLAIEPEKVYALPDHSLADDDFKLITTLSDLADRELVATIGWAKQVPGLLANFVWLACSHTLLCITFKACSFVLVGEKNNKT